MDLGMLLQPAELIIEKPLLDALSQLFRGKLLHLLGCI